MKHKLFLFISLTILAMSHLQAQNWLWAKGFGGPSMDESYCTATDIFGNVYVTGFFMGTMIIGADTLTEVGGGDIFISKFDASGNVQWSRHVGGNGMEWYSCVATDNFGNVFLSGNYGSATLNVGPFTITNNGFNDLFLVKFDSLGNPIWLTGGGGSFEERGYSIASDVSGSVCVTGIFNSAFAVFDNDTLFNSGGFNSTDVFLLKYDSAGALQWAKSARGSGYDESYSVKTDLSDNIIITGTFLATIIFDTDTLDNGGIFITKYNSSGSLVWAEGFPGQYNYNYGTNSIGTDAFGNIYLTGNFYSSTITLGSFTLTNFNFGHDDYFISKLNSSGTILWAKSAGGVNNDDGYSISANSDGSIYVTGSFDSSSITFGSITLYRPPNSSDPMFLVKYDSSGNELCAVALASGGDDQNAVALDASGNAYVFGDYYMNNFIIGADTLQLIGGEDFFLAKFSCDSLTNIFNPPTLPKPKIYPNPFSDKIFFSSFPGIADLTIYNMLGAQVFKTKLTSDHPLELKYLQDGTYFLELKSGSKRYMEKIIKQKN